MRRVLVVVGAVAVSVLAGPGPAQATTPRRPDAWASEYAGAGNAGVNAGERVITPANAARLKQAWVRHEPEGTYVAPSIVGGVLYQAVNPGQAAESSTFMAVSARTGKRLWALRLPAGNTYLRGQTVHGNWVVLPFEGWHHPGGVTVVNRVTRKIVWSRYQPPPRNNSTADRSVGGPVLVDAKRVYMYAASNPINVFRLSDGVPLWQLPWPNNPELAARSAALGNGILYATANAGLTAYNPATGHKLWTAPGWGPPVVAGSLVYSALPTGLAADPARGCGRRSCEPTWTRNFGNVTFDQVWVGAATTNNLYVAYTIDGQVINGRTQRYGRLQRLAATTGATRWSTGSAGTYPELPVRAGNTVWTVDNGATLHGFATNSSRTTPLVTRAEPPADTPSAVQGTAIADGTIAIQIWPSTLIGYRIPST